MSIDELKQAIFAERGVDEFQIFLKLGGDVNSRLPNSDWPLLALAVEFRNIPLIIAMVGAGADLEAIINNQSWRPLHLAVDIDIDSAMQATHGQDEFLETLTFDTTAALISLGANEQAVDIAGRTPRDIAARYGDAVLNKYYQISKMR